MDKAKLEEMEKEILFSTWTPSFEECSELIRLARLGLWAETHAIPILERMAYDNECQWHNDYAQETLAILAAQEKPDA